MGTYVIGGTQIDCTDRIALLDKASLTESVFVLFGLGLSKYASAASKVGLFRPTMRTVPRVVLITHYIHRIDRT